MAVCRAVLLGCLLAALLGSGCDYSPSYAGTRCSDDGACPGGYVCVQAGGEARCQPAGLPEGEADADGGDTDGDAEDGDGADADPGPDDGGGDVPTCPDLDGDGHRDVACGGDDCDDQDGRVHPGSVEACDGVDNDCDGVTDGLDLEGLRPMCSKQFGVCQGARHPAGDCVDGAWSECSLETYEQHAQAHQPEPQVYLYDELDRCDGLDNDCDSMVDEELLHPPLCPLQQGVCAGAVRTCLGALGYPDECGAAEYGPGWDETEVRCDLQDNDCDGETDEGLLRDCSETHLGLCADGSESCAAGVWGGCPEPGSEDCDEGLRDEDCDGDVNEGCDCDPTEERDCPLDLGVCQPAREHCDPTGHWPGCSYGADYEGAESRCDGLDNDCDGVVDLITRACSQEHTGLCAMGLETCRDGVWQDCPAAAAQDLCDLPGVDDDCDGQVDEDCECFGASQQGCANQQGVCFGSIQTCQAGAWLDCDYAAQEGHEDPEGSCDALDNDCDGAVDGMVRSCALEHTGRCAQGEETCSGGAWAGCPGPQDEDDWDSCQDDVDNDCDGETDRDDDACHCATGAGRGAPGLVLALLVWAWRIRRRRVARG